LGDTPVPVQKPQGWVASLATEIRHEIASLKPSDRMATVLTGFTVTALCYAKPEGTASAVTIIVLGAFLFCLAARWKGFDQ
jgi:hypothetical protein